MKKYLTVLFWVILVFPGLAQTQIPRSIQVRHSLDIDGQAKFIEAGVNNRNIANEVTLEAWVRTSQTHNQWILGKKDALGGFSLEIQNGRALFEGTGGPVTSSGLGQTVVNDNKWHHLAGIYAAGQWQIWVDGVLENASVMSGPVVTLTSAAQLCIAKNPGNASQYFKGLIGEIKLWNTARTAQQIRTFMSRTVETTSPELVGYFRCDDGAIYPNPPPYLTDFSDQKLHGVINTGIIIYGSGPPIGDESIFYYGADLNTKQFKLFVDADTVHIRNIAGAAKGIQLYTTYNSVQVTGQVPPTKAHARYYHGMMAVGDTNATYQVKFIWDTTICHRRHLFYARKDSRTLFSKVQPGRYNAATDTLSQYTVKDRGEFTFIFPNPNQIPPKVYSETVAKCPENFLTTLTAPEGRFFLWNTGATTKSIQVSQPGKYWVSLADYCSEFGSDTFRVVINPPLKLPTLKTTDTLICEKEPLRIILPAGFTYLWSNGSTADTFSIKTAGTYRLTTTDPRCGNSVISSIRVRTVNCVFIPNIITVNKDGRNDNFKIMGLPPGQWQLTIYSRWGRQVYQNLNYKNNWQAENLTTGVYYYLLQSPGTDQTYKGYVEIVW